MSRPDVRAYLGRCVTVLIDRPLGSVHPRHPDLRYPVNYGYLPGTVSGDGRPIDAYVVGVDEPVREAAGIVIAVALRADDGEDKLVVAPAGQHFTTEQITELITFQEQFFDSRIVIDEGPKISNL